MATKSDLKTEIENNGYEIVQDKQTGAEGNYKHFAIGAIKKTNGIAKREWFHIYEDTVSGNAYWQDKDPFASSDTTTTSFRDEIETLIGNKIVDGVIEGAFIVDINNHNEVATIKAIQENSSGNLIEQKYMVDRTNDGSLRPRVMG